MANESINGRNLIDMESIGGMIVGAMTVED
jgi:hypothetical protein